jgi:hypothetical protein
MIIYSILLVSWIRRGRRQSSKNFYRAVSFPIHKMTVVFVSCPTHFGSSVGVTVNELAIKFQIVLFGNTVASLCNEMHFKSALK